ncbi:hypothetical protein [Streptomyces sp. YS-3]
MADDEAGQALKLQQGTPPDGQYQEPPVAGGAATAPSHVQAVLQ